MVTLKNVPIYIPGAHSRVRWEPAYVLPLYKAAWRGKVQDPTDDVRILKPGDKAGYPLPHPAQATRILDAENAAEACAFERRRLEAEFSVNPLTNNARVDEAYPADAFDRAFEACLAPEPQTATLSDAE